MARGDGIHRTSARNAKLADADVSKTQGHNEREKESYSNQDIVPERTLMNVHFKAPTASYTEMFEQMVSDGMICILLQSRRLRFRKTVLRRCLQSSGENRRR